MKSSLFLSTPVIHFFSFSLFLRSKLFVRLPPKIVVEVRFHFCDRATPEYFVALDSFLRLPVAHASVLQ